MPTARQPAIFASWPAICPTAPAAQETTTVSPARGLPTSNSPKYAVSPVMPTACNASVCGSSSPGTGRSVPARAVAYSCHPSCPTARSPTENRRSLLSTTWPTLCAVITARTPANTAMTASTLDLMSGGRFLLGLGTSGPQVVEGWHGQPWGKPITRTREYVEIVRAALRRETVEFHGDQYEIPYAGADATGLGKPLKLLVRPLRASIPIYLAALSPKNVRTAFEIADGWLPIYFSPERARDAFGYEPRDGFDIAPSVNVVVSDDVEVARDMLRPLLAATRDVTSLRTMAELAL